MTSTITDRSSAIPLTDAEREALTDHAVSELYGYDLVADLIGDAASMTRLAAELTRAASLTEAAQAGSLPADLIETARVGLDLSIEDASRDVAGLTRYAADPAEIEDAETRRAALETLADKLLGAVA